MNEIEEKILKDMWTGIQNIQEQSHVNGIKLAETAIKVDRLESWVGNINNKLDTWDSVGCPKGRIVSQDIKNLKDEDKRTRENLKELNVYVENVKEAASEAKAIARNAKDAALSKNKAIIWGAAAGTMISAIVMFFKDLINR